MEKFNGRIVNTLSSTKAKLMEIVITLSLLKDDTKVHLETDSVAAISAIVGYTFTLIYRKVTCYKYGLILEMIKEMLRKKNISLTLYKIEAHLKYKWNNRADCLACIGTDNRIFLS